MSARPRALLDANVLYPAPLRDLLMQFAVDDLFAARWTADIHAEWIEALLRREPHRERARLERTAALMDEATRDALVTGHHALIPCLDLPDPDDRHVLAAAIVGRCDVVVTANTRDFPAPALAPYGIEAVHPDAFLARQIDRDPEAFLRSVRRVRARLRAPPLSAEQHLAVLERQGLTKTVEELRRRADRL